MSGDTREAAQRLDAWGRTLHPGRFYMPQYQNVAALKADLRALLLERQALREQWESERQKFLAALWRCYVAAGADTDGDSRFHMPDANARQCAVAAVDDLRADYDDDSDV